MAVFTIFTQKELGLVIAAIDAAIEAQIAAYQITPPSEDSAGDYGNDLHTLRLKRHELAALQGSNEGRARCYQCWADPEDGSLSLLPIENVTTYRQSGHISHHATLQYQIFAQTWEEAKAIHALRQGWAPYSPMSHAEPCPQCGANFYPLGSGDCWKCGHHQ
jgi:hypothetical protein